MAVTTFEKGLLQGQRTMLRKQLEARFGPLSAGAHQRLESLDTERLEALAPALRKAQSLQELGLEDWALARPHRLRGAPYPGRAGTGAGDGPLATSLPGRSHAGAWDPSVQQHVMPPRRACR
jgi:hypothetical protein